MWDHHTLQSRTGFRRGASSRTLAPEALAGKIHNFVLTTDGTLRTVVGPVEYHPDTYENNGGTPIANTDYDTPHSGLFHAVVGGRSILLSHHRDGSSNDVWLHEGWGTRWRSILTDGAYVEALADAGTKAFCPFPEANVETAWNTQFVATPVGVVIVPQGARAFITDGEIIYPLGYDTAPGPPTAYGPQLGILHEGDAEQTAGTNADLTPKSAADSPNKGGYSHNGRVWPEVFGTCRIGSVRNDALDVSAVSVKKSNSAGGVLSAGEWVAALQWADVFGNLSPYSGLSSPASVRKDDNLVQDKKKDEPESSERLKHQLAWGGLQAGPPGTVGRNLARCRDRRTSGDPNMYVVPDNAAVGRFASYTLPDNVCEMYPDNVPDTRLLLPAKEVDPMPLFRLAALFDGRLWIAHSLEEPNMFRASYPGMYGTLPKDEHKFYANYSGEGVTGLHAVSDGMLVFTETSTSIVYPNQGASGYQTKTLHANVGCVAPDSICTLPNGLTVWLGREGFYGYRGGDIREISGDIKDDELKRINRGRRVRACAAVDPVMGEYRCWIPIDGSDVNNHCVVYDGELWRSRDDVRAQAVCVTQDERHLMLALGSVLLTDEVTRHDSVWVLDHDGRGTREAAPHNAVFETVWLRNSRSHQPGSPVVVRTWYKETVDDTLTFEVFRNGRMHPATQTETTVERTATDTWTPLWDSTLTDSTHKESEYGDYLNNYWTSRRPYWRKVDVYLPATETCRFRISGAGDWEIIGMQYGENDSDAGGSKLMTGGPL